MKKLFTFVLILAVLVGGALLILPEAVTTVDDVSNEVYSSEQVYLEEDYDPYYTNGEIDPIKVYYMFKEEGMPEVVKVIECNGNCGANSYKYEIVSR